MNLIESISRNPRNMQQDIHDYAVIRTIFNALEDTNPGRRALARQYIEHIENRLTQDGTNSPILRHVRNFCTTYVANKIRTILQNPEIVTTNQLRSVLRDLPEPTLRYARTYSVGDIAENMIASRKHGRKDVKTLLRISFEDALQFARNRDRLTNTTQNTDNQPTNMSPTLQKTVQLAQQLGNEMVLTTQIDDLTGNREQRSRLQQDLPTGTTHTVQDRIESGSSVNRQRETVNRSGMNPFSELSPTRQSQNEYLHVKAYATSALLGESNNRVSIPDIGNNPNDRMLDYAIIDALFTLYRSNDPGIVRRACTCMKQFATCLQEKTYLARLAPMLQSYISHQIAEALYPTTNQSGEKPQLAQLLMNWTGCDFLLVRHFMDKLPDTERSTFNQMSKLVDVPLDQFEPQSISDDILASVRQREEALKGRQPESKPLLQHLVTCLSEGKSPELEDFSNKHETSRKRTLQEVNPEDRPEDNNRTRRRLNMEIRQDDSTLFEKAPEKE